MAIPLHRRLTETRPDSRLAVGLLCGLTAALLLGLLSGTRWVASLEQGALDAQMRQRGARYPYPAITIIVADDASVTRLGWPMRRTVYASLVDRLARAGARTIAFDILFSQPAPQHSDDLAFANACRRSGRVVQACTFQLRNSPNELLGSSPTVDGTGLAPGFQVQDHGAVCPSANGQLASQPELLEAATAMGHLNVPPDPDGVLRHIPHLIRYRGGLCPSLALAAAAQFLGVAPGRMAASPQPDGAVVELPGTTTEAPRHVLLDGNGAAWINWINGNTAYPTFTILQVLDGVVPPAALRDHLVLVGVTATGSLEYHPTPFSALQPAVELQANAVDDILSRRTLANAPRLGRWLVLLLLPLAIGGLAARRDALTSLAGLVAASGLLWWLAFRLLAYDNLHLPVAAALLAGVIAWGLTVAYEQVADARRLRVTAAHLAEATERYTLAVQGANDGLWDWDLTRDHLYYAPRWKAMLGYNEAEIGAAPAEWLERVHPDDRAEVLSRLERHRAGVTPHFESEHGMRHRDGSYRWMLVRGLAVRDGSGTATRIAGSQSDVTDRRLAEEQVRHDAFHDALTGLPNRALLMDRLQSGLNRALRHSAYRFALFFVDLDRFKVVNDSLGHSAGDQLLVAASQRLMTELRPGDTIARLGGDEFVVLAEVADPAPDATRIAERIRQQLADPFRLQTAVGGAQDVFVNASIGVALSTSGYLRPEEIVRDADIAMYRAKAQGGSRHEMFDRTMHDQALRRLRLETDLRRSLERDELLLYYQPIVSLASGQVAGFEALMRWQHPESGLVSPGEFIPLAEETGLIVAMDRWGLHTACRQAQQWQKQQPEQPVLISINLSSRQFTQPGLLEEVRRALQETGIDSGSVKLEITESALMDNPDNAASMLRELKALGVRLSIDDFGTGYSSLSYLHRFPLDMLKIDRSFTQRMCEGKEDLQIVWAILTLARNLGMEVIAEGVETIQQLEQLRTLTCDFGQGYLFAKPLEPGAAGDLLRRAPRW